jgi:hypothetical protein
MWLWTSDGSWILKIRQLIFWKQLIIRFVVANCDFAQLRLLILNE